MDVQIVPQGEPARKIRVLLLLTSLHGGGAERVAVAIYNGLDRSRFEVHLGLLRLNGPYVDDLADTERVHVAPEGEERFNYDGPNKAQYSPLKLIGSAWRAPRALRKIVEQVQPDVVMSFLKGTNVLTWGALGNLKPRPKWIAREGNNVAAVLAEEAPNPVVRGISRWLTRRAYRRADAVLVNSQALREGLARDLDLERERVRVIPNPIDIGAIRTALARPAHDVPRRPFIISVGRLEYQKAHDLLLDAFASSAVRETHDLVILGKGSRLARLQAQARALGIADRVRFVGFAANPFAWMAAADLFVLPSRWEGFPTAVAEAMACGVPMLLADCGYGPREMVQDGKCGVLVPVGDVDALADSMESLIADPARRSWLAACALERVKSFDAGPMLAGYATLFRDMAGRRGPALTPDWAAAGLHGAFTQSWHSADNGESDLADAAHARMDGTGGGGRWAGPCRAGADRETGRCG